jgi:hypothetical protein
MTNDPHVCGRHTFKKYLLFIKNILAFWPSGGVKPVSNDLLQVKPWWCMIALSLPLSLSLRVERDSIMKYK